MSVTLAIVLAFNFSVRICVLEGDDRTERVCWEITE